VKRGKFEQKATKAGKGCWALGRAAHPVKAGVGGVLHNISRQDAKAQRKYNIDRITGLTGYNGDK